MPSLPADRSPALDRHSKGGRPPISLDELVAIRQYPPEAIDALHANLPDVAAFHENVLLRERAGHSLTAEIYRPHGRPPFPVVLYLHGGGWCGDYAAVARRPAMRMAAAGFVVINLDYALAPEYPFPWALEDCIYAVRWAVRNAAGYDGDPTKLALSGDSAGANLAAATISVLHGQGDEVDGGDLAGVAATIAGAILFYGSYDVATAFCDPQAPSGYRELWLQAYLGPHFLSYIRHPLVSPMRAPNLDRFPPVYLSVGDRDWLLGQAARMAEALAAVGVPTTLSVTAGLDHGFQYVDPLDPAAVEELDRVSRWLRGRLGGGLAE